MKRFLAQVVLFLSLSSIVIIALFYFSSKIVNKRAVFKISNKIDKIIVGHSHPECAYNDALIDNFKNLANSGEASFYNYYKTIKIMEANPNISTVFCEFSNNQIEERLNQNIWGERSMLHYYPTYAPFVDDEGNQLLLNKNFSSFVNSSGASIRSAFFRILTANYDYSKKMGKYLYLDKFYKDSIRITDNTNHSIDINSYKISEYNIKYLKKTVQHVKNLNKDVYLVRTPTHNKDPDLGNQIVFQEVLKQHFSNVEYVDFQEFELLDEDFADVEHLNYRGAKKFSVFFNYLLENGLLQKENKQEFINKEIEQWERTSFVK